MSNGTSTQVLPDLSERALRILPIAADLLPEEIVEARRERQARRLVLAGLAGFLALLTGWYGITLLQTSAAGSGLAAAQDDISRLQAQQNKYADVVSAQAESHRIQAALGSLMANDLQWSRLVHDIGGAVPGELTLAGVTGALNGANQAGAVPDVTARMLARSSRGTSECKTIRSAVGTSDTARGRCSRTA